MNFSTRFYLVYFGELLHFHVVVFQTLTTRQLLHFFVVDVGDVIVGVATLLTCAGVALLTAHVVGVVADGNGTASLLSEAAFRPAGMLLGRRHAT